MYQYLNKYINHRMCFPFFKIKIPINFFIRSLTSSQTCDLWPMVAATSTQLQELFLQEHKD